MMLSGLRHSFVAPSPCERVVLSIPRLCLERDENAKDEAENHNAPLERTTPRLHSLLQLRLRS